MLLCIENEPPIFMLDIYFTLLADHFAEQTIEIAMVSNSIHVHVATIMGIVNLTKPRISNSTHRYTVIMLVTGVFVMSI